MHTHARTHTHTHTHTRTHAHTHTHTHTHTLETQIRSTVCYLCRDIRIQLAIPEDPPPVEWWHMEADKSLLIGTIKYGKSTWGDRGRGWTAHTHTHTRTRTRTHTHTHTHTHTEANTVLSSTFLLSRLRAVWTDEV